MGDDFKISKIMQNYDSSIDARGNPAFEKIDIKQMGLDPELIASKNFLAFLKEVPTLAGEPIGRIFISDDQVGLIGKGDYHFVVGPSLRYEEKPAAVLSLLNGARNGSGYLIAEQGQELPKLDDPDIQRRIIQCKWILGYFQYSDEEKNVLKDWLKSLTPEQQRAQIAFIHDRTTPEQEKLMQSLIKA